VASWILELDRGESIPFESIPFESIPFEGNSVEYEQDRERCLGKEAL